MLTQRRWSTLKRCLPTCCRFGLSTVGQCAFFCLFSTCLTGLSYVCMRGGTARRADHELKSCVIDKYIWLFWENINEKLCVVSLLLLLVCPIIKLQNRVGTPLPRLAPRLMRPGGGTVCSCQLQSKHTAGRSRLINSSTISASIVYQLLWSGTEEKALPWLACECQLTVGDDCEWCEVWSISVCLAAPRCFLNEWLRRQFRIIVTRGLTYFFTHFFLACS